MLLVARNDSFAYLPWPTVSKQSVFPSSSRWVARVLVRGGAVRSVSRGVGRSPGVGFLRGWAVSPCGGGAGPVRGDDRRGDGCLTVRQRARGPRVAVVRGGASGCAAGAAQRRARSAAGREGAGVSGPRRSPSGPYWAG